MRHDRFFVYILSNKKRGVLYIGVTSELGKRIEEHKNKNFDGFTKKYNVDKLVYYESVNDADMAIEGEKNLKNWKRDWKIQLIEKYNPEWKDLYYDMFD